MIQLIQKIAYFLHITDGQGQLDIVDLSFIALTVKIIIEPNMDWGAVCGLVPIIAQQMHINHLESKSSNSQSKTI